jgi:ribonuclease P protein component
MADHRFPKRLRLLRPSEFDAVMSARTSAADALVRMYGAANALGHPRLGFVVSRRVGTAPTRNAWKRALREAFRLAQHKLPACDLVCIPQRHAAPSAFRLVESLPSLARRIEAQLRRQNAP